MSAEDKKKVEDAVHETVEWVEPQPAGGGGGVRGQAEGAGEPVQPHHRQDVPGERGAEGGAGGAPGGGGPRGQDEGREGPTIERWTKGGRAHGWHTGGGGLEW